jgi:nitrogen regulatory protein PII
VVVAIIKPNMYFKTREALNKEGFSSMSTKEVLGRGRKKVHTELNINTESGDKEFYDNEMYAKKMLEIYVRDEEVDLLIKTIVRVNRTNNAGDGKIFVCPADKALRIRTSEKDNEALM